MEIIEGRISVCSEDVVNKASEITQKRPSTLLEKLSQQIGLDTGTCRTCFQQDEATVGTRGPRKY